MSNKNKWIARVELDPAGYCTHLHREMVDLLKREGVLVSVANNLTRVTRTVAGQGTDGSFNGQDYEEERWITPWTVVGEDTP